MVISCFSSDQDQEIKYNPLQFEEKSNKTKQKDTNRIQISSLKINLCIFDIEIKQ